MLAKSILQIVSLVPIGAGLPERLARALTRSSLVRMTRLKLYASSRLISVPTRGSLLVRKCVEPIRALSVAKGWCIVVSWQQAVAVQVKARPSAGHGTSEKGSHMRQFASCIIPLVKINADRASRSREQGRSRWIVVLATIVSSASCIPGSASAQMTNTPANITAAFSGKCFEVSDMSTADGALIVQNSCTGAENQQWTLRPYLDAYQLIAKHSGKCLAVQDASKSDGAKAIQLSCKDKDSQAGYAWQYGSGFELAARHSSKCLAVRATHRRATGHKVQSTCDHNADQL